MGNYESLKTGASVVLDFDDNEDLQELQGIADKMLDSALGTDIKEASELTDVRNSYILSWGK